MNLKPTKQNQFFKQIFILSTKRKRYCMRLVYCNNAVNFSVWRQILTIRLDYRRFAPLHATTARFPIGKMLFQPVAFD